MVRLTQIRRIKALCLMSFLCTILLLFEVRTHRDALQIQMLKNINSHKANRSDSMLLQSSSRVLTTSISNPVVKTVTVKPEVDYSRLSLPNASDLDDGCPELDGHNEWTQYIRLIADNLELDYRSDVTGIMDKALATYKMDVGLKSRHTYSNAFTYEVQYNMTQGQNSDVNIRFIIREFSGGIPTHGGSSLWINVTSFTHAQVCPVKDYFNGTYLVCCNVDMRTVSASFNVNILKAFHNFEAFVLKNKKNVKSIWTKTIDVQEFNSDKSIIYQTCSNVSHLDTSQGYWTTSPEHLYPDTYVVATSKAPGKRCLLKEMSNTTMTQCFIHTLNSSLTLMGDSHLRLSYYYLSPRAGGPVLYKKVQENFDVGENHFKWTPYCPDMQKELELYLTQRKSASHKDWGDVGAARRWVVVLDGGNWSVWRKESSKQIFVNCMLLSVIPLIIDITTLPHTLVIWQGVPPPGTSIKWFATYESNPYVYAMFDYMIHTLLAPHGVRIIPTSAITWPVNHRVGKEPPHIISPMSGWVDPSPPGAVVAQLIMYHACDL